MNANHDTPPPADDDGIAYLSSLEPGYTLTCPHAAPFLSAATVTTFSLLLFQGEGWSLDFQMEPERRVIRRGRVPTEADLRNIAMTFPGSMMPAMMLQLLPIVAASLPDEGAA